MASNSGIFDIRETFPANCDLESPTVKDSVHRINLMVLVLGDLKYRDFFTADLGLLVTGLLGRVDEAYQNGLIDQIQCDEILESAQDLAAVLEGTGLTLQKALVTARDQLPKGIWVPSQKIRSHGISLPYLDQADYQKTAAQDVFDAGFLNDKDAVTKPGVGDMTEYDIFTTSAEAYPEVRAIIMAAKEAAVADAKPNDMACDWPDCVPCTGYFCNIDSSTDACTAASDPVPEGGCS